METHFLLADNVYCKASVPPTDKVCLWLGVSILSEHFISRIKPKSNESKRAVLWTLFIEELIRWSLAFSSHPDVFSSQANVMLEYDIDEAQALLEKNLSTASRNLETLEEDLDFLRDQFTTTEVSILPQRSPPRRRLHHWWHWQSSLKQIWFTFQWKTATSSGQTTGFPFVWVEGMTSHCTAGVVSVQLITHRISVVIWKWLNEYKWFTV